MQRRDFLQTTAAVTIASASAPFSLAAAPSKPAPFLSSYLNFSQLFKSLETRARREEAIDRALDRHRASGFNAVMPYITSTSGEASYPSRIMKCLRFKDWDPLAYLIAGADQRGLDVYPVFCALSCGHDEPAGVLAEHPEWALRKPDGKPMGHICPTNPNARDWVASVVAEVVERYPTQGILLDYLRYYNRPTLLDVASEKTFAAHKAQHQDVAEKELMQRFREAGLTALARQISETARALRPKLKIAIYSWGPHVASHHRVAQAWPIWSREGYVDNVNISGYCYPENYGDKYLEVFDRRIGDAVKLNRKNLGRAEVTFCLGIVTSHGQIKEASWINDYLTRAVVQGATGSAVFTWSRLEPFLTAADRLGYFRKFLQATATK